MKALHKKSESRSSLCDLRVLFVSVVDEMQANDTTETQSAQRTHREIPVQGLFVQNPFQTYKIMKLSITISPRVECLCPTAYIQVSLFYLETSDR